MPLSESDLQRAIISWAATKERAYPELKWLFHPANGGKRDSREAQSLKQQGVRKGICDLYLDVARGGYHGWRCELKIGSGKPSAEQIEYLEFLTEQGYFAFWSNSFEQVKLYLVDYLEGRLVRGPNA